MAKKKTLHARVVEYLKDYKPSLDRVRQARLDREWLALCDEVPIDYKPPVRSGRGKA